AAGALAGELHADADARAHTVGLSVLEDQRQLVEVLDDRDDGAPELGRARHRLDVAVVLEAVAHDQAVGGVLGHGHDRQQLGLGADLEPEAELASVAVDLLDHEALLVHLDGEHGRIAILVVVLGDRLGERRMHVAQAVRQDVRETHHDGCRKVARLQPLHDLEEVDVAPGPGLGVGAHHDMAGGVDREVALAPRVDMVKLERVLDPPGLGGVGLAIAAVDGAFRVCGHFSGGRYQKLKSIAVRRIAPPGLQLCAARLLRRDRGRWAASDRGSTRSTSPGTVARHPGPPAPLPEDCDTRSLRSRTWRLPLPAASAPMSAANAGATPAPPETDRSR